MKRKTIYILKEATISVNTKFFFSCLQYKLSSEIQNVWCVFVFTFFKPDCLHHRLRCVCVCVMSRAAGYPQCTCALLCTHPSGKGWTTAGQMFFSCQGKNAKVKESKYERQRGQIEASLGQIFSSVCKCSRSTWGQHPCDRCWRWFSFSSPVSHGLSYLFASGGTHVCPAARAGRADPEMPAASVQIVHTHDRERRGDINKRKRTYLFTYRQNNKQMCIYILYMPVHTVHIGYSFNTVYICVNISFKHVFCFNIDITHMHISNDLLHSMSAVTNQIKDRANRFL